MVSTRPALQHRMKFTLLFCIFGFLSPQLVSSTESMNHEGASLRNKRSAEDSSYFYYQEPGYPRDCKEVYEQCEGSSAESGVYMIKPEGADEPFNVYCNNSIDGGGWTVLQRRVDGSVEFYRYWNEFKQGFGFLKREFWLGNEKISLLTNQQDYMLRIDLNNEDGDPYFAKYDLFRISDEQTKYRLVGLGVYDSSSTAGGDGMNYYRNQSFTTYDSDNDISSYNTAQYYHGAWWHKYSYYNLNHGYHQSSLNGLYAAGSTFYKSIYWINLPESRYHIKYSEMKIRPV